METNLELKHPYLNRRRRSIVHDFFYATSIHGLPAIARSYNPRNLLCWSVIFCLFFGIMLYFVIVSILAYFTYPTQTNVDIVVEYPMPFPAVTVCNYALLRYDLIVGPFLNYTNSIGLTSSNNTAALDFSNSSVLAGVYDFLVDLANKNEDVFYYMYYLNELLFSCTYNGIACNASDFVQFTSSTYGLCYTFNVKTSSKDGNTSLRTTVDNGGQGDLKLEFYIYDYLYVPYLSDGVGLIAMLHDNTQVPQIDIDGIGLAPNRKHTLQFSKKTMSFLSAPYTNCTTAIRADMKAMFESSYADVEYEYSRQICLSLCEEAYVYSVCNCTSPYFWNVRSVLLSNGTVVFAPICKVVDPCSVAAITKFTNDSANFEQQCSHCTTECELTSFDVQLSSILAPGLFTQIAIKQWIENNALINNSRTIDLPPGWANNSSTYINQNYVGLEVVLGTALVTSYTQSATLSWTDVISNVGGQTGLWIGVSMLSLVELLEMFYRLIRMHFSKMKKKKQNTLEK